MGNNNATNNLTEECSKLASMSMLESVPLKTTQDHVFLAGEGKYGEKQNESFSDGNIDKETQETETEIGSKEIVEDPKLTKVKEQMSHNGLESLVMETDEQLQKNTSIAEVYKEEKGMKLGREAILKSMSRCRSLSVSHNNRVMGNSLVQQMVSEVSFPTRNNSSLCNRSEVLLVSCLKINEAQEATEAITESTKEARLVMRYPSFSNDLRVEGRSHKSMEKTQLLSQDKTETDKATLDMEEETVMLKRSETEKRRGFELSLGLSMKPTRRSDGDNSFKETKGSGHNLFDKKSITSETLLISSIGSSRAKETTEVITKSNKVAVSQMRSSSFVNDLRTKERIIESTEQILLLCQEKTETYEATINVEKKTVMLKRSESEKTRGFELSLGLSLKTGDRSEADNSLNLKETKDTGDNLLEKKAYMKGRVRKRRKSSLFGSCLCFATAMN